jgi:hypothetical protein
MSGEYNPISDWKPVGSGAAQLASNRAGQILR